MRRDEGNKFCSTCYFHFCHVCSSAAKHVHDTLHDCLWLEKWAASSETQLSCDICHEGLCHPSLESRKVRLIVSQIQSRTYSARNAETLTSVRSALIRESRFLIATERGPAVNLLSMQRTERSEMGLGKFGMPQRCFRWDKFS